MSWVHEARVQKQLSFCPVAVIHKYVEKNTQCKCNPLYWEVTICTTFRSWYRTLLSRGPVWSAAISLSWLCFSPCIQSTPQVGATWDYRAHLHPHWLWSTEQSHYSVCGNTPWFLQLFMLLFAFLHAVVAQSKASENTLWISGSPFLHFDVNSVLFISSVSWGRIFASNTEQCLKICNLPLYFLLNSRIKNNPNSSQSLTPTDSNIPSLECGRTDCLSCMATARTAMIPSVSRRGDDKGEKQIFFQYKGWKELQISL